MRLAAIAFLLFGLVALPGCGQSAAEKEAAQEFELGRQAGLRKEYEKEISHYDRSITIKPTAKAYALRASSHLYDGRLELAEDDIKKAAELDPNLELVKKIKADIEKLKSERK